jgi:hypothetical protein
VAVQELLKGLLGALPRIDHHARPTGLGSKHETVCLEGTGGETSDEHGAPRSITQV